ncbi:T9SS type A sorting domain-containing protein [bacterium]|nr:T9SS type A sorting domain-containing protein [bacterium]
MVKKLILLIFIFSTISYSQTQWVRNGIKGASAVSSQINLNCVSTGTGGVFFAYENDPQGDADIYVQYIDGAGNAKWGPDGKVICSAAGNQKRPTITSDGSGGLYVAWEDEVSEDIYIQHLDAQGNELWVKDGIRICSAAGLQSRVEAVYDGTGSVTLVWIDERSGNGTDIYAQRVNSSGNALWQTNGVPVCTESGNQSSHVIKSDGSGGVFVVWQDYRNGYANIDIYAQHINSSGSPLFGSQGISVVSAANNQQKPDIDINGTDIFVSWQDFRSGTNNDIYVQKFDINGSPQWGANGYPVCTAGGHQTNSQIISDGSGGVIIVWDDNRTGYDIYGQQMSSNGIPQWEANGKVINASSGYQYTSRVVSDGAHGAFVIWNDDHSSPSDLNIFVQHIKSDGTLLFPEQGYTVVDTTGYQDGHCIVEDGAGGFIALWRDGRDGNSDVYVQHINDAITFSTPSAGNLWAGDREQTITWELKPESVIFDHLIVKASASPGDGFPIIVQDNVSPSLLSVNWAPQSVSSTSVRIKIDGILSDGTLVNSYQSGQFSIDSEPPDQFHLLSPVNNTNTTLDVTFQWETASDNLSGLDHYELWLNNSVFTDTLHSNSISLAMDEGTFVWTVKAVDKAGVVRTAEEAWNFSTSRDNDPPTIFHLQSPSNDSWTAEKSPEFIWSGSTDAGSGLMKYQFYLDGEMIKDNMPPTQHSFSSAELSLGSHTWHVIAVDSVGNSMESEEINTINVDYVKPEQFSLRGPDDGVWVNTAYPEFSWEAVSDTGAGLEYLQLWMDGELLIDNINPSGTSLIPGSGYAVSEGSHEWYISAKDSVGNIRKSTEIFELNVDITRPEPFLLMQPADNSFVTDLRPAFQWETANDAVSGVSSYNIYIDDQLVSEGLTNPSYIPDYDIAEGHHIWKVKAVDAAGNSKNSHRFGFTLDVSSPESFALISPSAGAVLHTRTPDFAWHKTDDAVSGFASYTFVIEGITTIENISQNDTLHTLSTSFANGTYTWHVAAFDSAGNVFTTPDQAFEISCNPPQLTSSASVSATEDEPFNYTVAFTDPDGDDVNVTFLSIPSWLTRNNMIFSGTPSEATQDTVIVLNFSDGIFTEEKRITVNIIHVNDPPVITSSNSAAAVEDSLFTYTATAYDVENDALAFTYITLPKWLTAANAVVSGTPREGDQDTCFVVIVSDGADTDTLRVDVTVRAVNDPPVITSSGAVTATEGKLFRYKASVEDVDSKNVFVKYYNLPSWLSLSGPELRGIPENQSTDTCFTVIASDGELSDTLIVMVTVNHVNSSPGFVYELGTWQFYDDDTLKWSVNLDEYISDPDDPDSALTWTYELPDTNNVTVSINEKSHVATIVAHHTQGAFRVIFTATDPHGASASCTLYMQIIMTYVDNTSFAVPKSFALYNNYPNPFNAKTVIKYDVPVSAKVNISVYNTLGRKVGEIINELQQPGVYKFEWDGDHFPTGVYFIVMQSGSYRKVQRMILLK